MPAKQISKKTRNILIAVCAAVVVFVCASAILLHFKLQSEEAVRAEFPTGTTGESTAEITTEIPELEDTRPGTDIEKDNLTLPSRVEQPKPDYSDKTLKLLNVPFIDQRQKYPTGCESVAAVMALQYLGIPMKVETFIDVYLDRGRTPYSVSSGERFGDDPRKVFLGNPYSASKGWGCWAPVIVNAVNKFIDKDKFSVEGVYGVPLETLCKQYIDNGVPVLIWATQNMAKPHKAKSWTITGTKETFTWISPMHCLLLVGYDSQYYYFNDSLQGKNYRYKKSSVDTAYAGVGKQAVVIAKRPELPPPEEIPDTEPSALPPASTVTEPTTGFESTTAVQTDTIPENSTEETPTFGK